MIDQNEVRRLTFVRDIEWFETVDSTNTCALAWNGDSDRLPLLIGAESQTRGRGRGEKTWWARAGALTFSVLLTPENWAIAPSQWPLLSLATGLAICRAVSPVIPGVDVRLKWPNDVYADGRKLCGILLESHPHHADCLVIGIGLNVNNSLSHAPEELQQTATSLTDLTASVHDRTQVLVSLLQALNEELTAVGEEGGATLMSRFRERCFLTGRVLTIRDAGDEVTGTCLGIDDDGALRLLTPQGPRRILAGVVSF